MSRYDHYSFWLVQRLEPDWGGRREVVCEYMGSSEFEFGSIPRSRKRLDAEELVTIEYPITYKGGTKTVHFLGAFTGIEAKIAAMQEWVASGMRGKELANFDVAFTGLDWSGEPASDYYRTKVWWAIGENVDLVWAIEQEWLEVFTTQRGIQATPFGTL